MRVVTWAMQGAPSFGQSKWRSDVARLFRAGAEVVCLQECGEPPAHAVPTAPPPWLPAGAAPPAALRWQYTLWNIGPERRPLYVNILWLETDPCHRRANLAIAFANASVAALNFICLPPGLAGQRPALGVRVGYGDTSIDIYTVHTIAPGGPDAAGLIKNIAATASTSWFAAGIYHAPFDRWRDDLALVAVVCPHNGYVTHPGGGTNLDYAIKSAAGGPTPGTVFPGFVVSDHSPISYLL